MHMSLASLRSEGGGGGGGGGGWEGPRENVGTLQASSEIAPPTVALFFIKSPTLYPVASLSNAT